MRTLVTSVGSNTSISVIKALRLNEIGGISIIGTDLNEPIFCAGANMVDRFYKIPSANEKQAYEEALLEIIQVEKIDCVIGIHDLELERISSLKKRYSDKTFWAVNNAEIIALCNDKKRANQFCRNIGINVPRSYSINELSELKIRDFPLIIKPILGVSSAGIHFVNSQEDLLAFLKNNEISKYIIQEIVRGDEYTIDCYCTKDGTFYGASPRKRLETKAGISVKGQIVENLKLVDYCRTILEEMKYCGASNIQFIEQDGTFYFIEINPRFSGAGILSYRAGLNSPLYTILEAAGRTSADFGPLNIQFGMTMTRYWQEQFYDREGNPI